MKKLLLCLTLAGCVHGQVHLENDIGAVFNKNDDKYFTHGTKLSSIHLDPDGHKEELYSAGQNIYTPSKKHIDASPSILSTDRPYSGWLYLEYRNEQVKDQVKTVYGIQAGCSGPCSFAKETQSTIHKLLKQNVPSWDPNYALKSEPGIILEGEKYYEIIGTSHFSSSLFSRLRGGNIIDSGSIGSKFEWGEGIDNFAPEPIIFKIPKEVDKLSYYIFGDVEERGVPYNHFLDGSLFQKEHHTVNSNFFVTEANLGFRVGYNNLKFSYNYTIITDEWEGQKGPFFFGGIDWSW